jgi:hypothetical protein
MSSMHVLHHGARRKPLAVYGRALARAAAVIEGRVFVRLRARPGGSWHRVVSEGARRLAAGLARCSRSPRRVRLWCAAPWRSRDG